MSIIIHLLFCLPIAYFLLIFAKDVFEVRKEPNLDHHLKNSYDWELKPMFAADFDKDIKKNVDLKQFYDHNCGTAMNNYNRLVKTVNNYIHRYVSLFLIASGIFDQERKYSDETVTIDLQITISPEDLAYLQNFSQGREESSVLRDLSRLDAILSNIIKKREKSYLECVLRFSVSLLYFIGHCIYRLLVMPNFYYYAPIIIILLVTFAIYSFSPRRSFYVYVVIILNSMIFWESLNLYRKKIKDIEIELETFKMRKMPEECHDASIKWYYYLTSFFTGDRCLEYQKNINRNPLYEVSLLQCIFDTYSFYLIRTPCKILGVSIRDITGEISALWPQPIRWLIQLPLLLYIIISLAFLLLVLCGKRLKLSFFGASVEIGDSAAVKERTIINKQGSRRLVSYRPLRILAKSRFLRRSELNLPEENKLVVKASESEGAVESKNCDTGEPSTAEKVKFDVF